MPRAELLLDTHVWVPLALDAKKFDSKAKRRLERAADEGSLLLSTISIWEVAMLSDAGRLRLPPTAAEWARSAIQAARVTLVPVDFDIALDAGRQSATHGDPADRIIFATAAVRGATLVTADQKLLAHAKKAKLPALVPW